MLTCLICNKLFEEKFIARHVKNHRINGLQMTKSRYKDRFGVVLPKRISWNKGLTSFIDSRLKNIGLKISKSLKDGYRKGTIKNWTEGLNKETDSRVKSISDKLKGHRIFVDPNFLGTVNKVRLAGKSYEMVYGAELAEKMREMRSGENSSVWVPRETRACLCGCGNTFEVRINSVKKFIHTHNVRGENNPNWSGGLHDQDYVGFTRKLRLAVKERDDNECKLCFIFGVKLDVHHIDYNKKNSVLGNLITLCSSCHATTNFNRSFWQARLIQVMDKLYGK